LTAVSVRIQSLVPLLKTKNKEKY